MPQDERPQEIAQLAKLVAWLDEQRKLDKDTMARLSQQVERLSQGARETGAQLTDFHERLRQAQAGSAHFPLIDSGLRQVREQIAELQRSIQDVDQRAGRSAGLTQAETARAAKALEDLNQQLVELYRRDEGLQSRLQLLSEEVRHDRAASAVLPPRIENGEKLIGTLNSRLQLLEEHVKRVEGQIAGLEQVREEQRAEQKRLWQWQQSAELRWARQLAEWAQHIEQWQIAFAEQTKVLQELSKDSVQLRQGLETLTRETDRQHDRLDEAQDALLRLESGQQSASEEMNLLLQGAEAQRRRVDELGYTAQQLEETLRKESAGLVALGRRLDGERGRIDELIKALQQDEIDQRGEHEELDRLRREVQSQRFYFDEALAKLGQAVGELRHNHQERLAEALGTQERQLARQIEELEQQARELREHREGIVAGLKRAASEIGTQN